jgi:hypothetical protein
MSRSGKVYFVGAPGRIKIGFTTKPEERLIGLQSQDLEKLHAIAIVDGSRALERHLHTVCAQHRKYKEWFEDNEFVRDVIAKTVAGEITVTERPKPAEETNKDDPEYFFARILPILSAREEASRLYRIFLEELVEVINARKAAGKPIEAFVDIYRRMERGEHRAGQAMVDGEKS